MAAPNLTLTLNKVESSRRATKWYYKVVPAGATYAAGGDVVDFTAATVPAGQPSAVPYHIPTVDEVSFDSPMLDFMQPVFVAGTTMKNAKIKFLTAADTEASAYSAGAQAAQLNFTITQRRGYSS